MTNASINPATAENTPPTRGFKRLFNPLMIMVVLFGLPYVLSWYFLYGGDPIAFESPNNHGELVSPMIPLDAYTLTQTDQTTLTSTSLAGQWTLISVTSSCDHQCEENLFNLRQTRKALGVNRKVIKPILLLTQPQALAPLSIDLTHEFPQLAIITPTADAKKLLNTLKALTPTLENSVFMIDPLGNIMMTYPAGYEQKGLLKDLQRLLKVFKPNL